MSPAFDLLLFAALPYVAALLCIVGTVERYLRHGSSITSMSSQLLENRLHFWALVPFHAGILIVLLGHLVAFLMPATLLAWNSVPARLYLLEGTGFAGGLLALGGFVAITFRRVRLTALRERTHAVDWAIYAVLLVQLASGVATALFYPWGSSWFAVAAVPYLRSLLILQPDIAAAAALPLLPSLHLAGMWVLLALFPFSRLVHIIVVPHSYLWRAPQVVRWRQRPALLHGRKS